MVFLRSATPVSSSHFCFASHFFYTFNLIHQPSFRRKVSSMMHTGRYYVQLLRFSLIISLHNAFIICWRARLDCFATSCFICFFYRTICGRRPLSSCSHQRGAYCILLMRGCPMVCTLDLNQLFNQSIHSFPYSLFLRCFGRVYICRLDLS